MTGAGGPLGDQRVLRTSVIRPDIQTIRALAVALVVLNHLWPGDLPGGYLGVDVFFVLSGYLITSHLRREVDSTGTVKLGAFWARRAKRLLPAALLVLIASAAITLICVPLVYQQSAFQQIGAAGTYFLNWLLVIESADYFASGSAISPVTHYWSLSVEEQFYVVWPLIILAALLVTKARSNRTRNKAILVAMILVFGASLCWAIYSTANGNAGAYFATTGRAWEFAAGSLLAFLPHAPAINRHMAAAASWMMWGVLIACSFAYGPLSGFPGALALIPVAATVALIWIPSPAAWAPQQVLVVRPTVFLGDISYSLYLWHWPIIVAAFSVVGGSLNGAQKAIVIAISVLLAWLTKKYVEDPVRRTRLRSLRSPVGVLVAAVASIALLWGGVAAATPDVSGRAQAAVEELNERARSNEPCFGARASFEDCTDSHTLSNLDFALYNWELTDRTVNNGSYCSYKWGQAELDPCSFGAEDAAKVQDVALVGDSHAAMLVFALDSIAVEQGLRVHTYFAEACAALDDDRIAVAGSTEKQRSDRCNVWRAKVIRELEHSAQIDTIITTSFDSAYFHTDSPTVPDAGDGYVRAWQRWIDAGKTVIVMNDVPRHPGSVPECIFNASTLVDPCAVDAEQLSTDGPLAAAASKIDSSRFHFIDHRAAFCDDDLCRTVIGGIPAYIDSNHMTSAFSRTFGEYMFPVGIFTVAAEGS